MQCDSRIGYQDALSTASYAQDQRQQQQQQQQQELGTCQLQGIAAATRTSSSTTSTTTTCSRGQHETTQTTTVHLYRSSGAVELPPQLRPSQTNSGSVQQLQASNYNNHSQQLIYSQELQHQEQQQQQQQQYFVGAATCQEVQQYCHDKQLPLRGGNDIVNSHHQQQHQQQQQQQQQQHYNNLHTSNDYLHLQGTNHNHQNHHHLVHHKHHQSSRHHNHLLADKSRQQQIAAARYAAQQVQQAQRQHQETATTAAASAAAAGYESTNRQMSELSVCCSPMLGSPELASGPLVVSPHMNMADSAFQAQLLRPRVNSISATGRGATPSRISPAPLPCVRSMSFSAASARGCGDAHQVSGELCYLADASASYQQTSQPSSLSSYQRAHTPSLLSSSNCSSIGSPIGSSINNNQSPLPFESLSPAPPAPAGVCSGGSLLYNTTNNNGSQQQQQQPQPQPQLHVHRSGAHPTPGTGSGGHYASGIGHSSTGGSGASSSSCSTSDSLSMSINLEQYISKRNERERSRVRNVNDAFDHLKSSLPLEVEKMSKRMSKVEILRTAIGYIRNLEQILDGKQQLKSDSHHHHHNKGEAARCSGAQRRHQGASSWQRLGECAAPGAGGANPMRALESASSAKRECGSQTITSRSQLTSVDLNNSNNNNNNSSFSDQGFQDFASGNYYHQLQPQQMMSFDEY